MGRLQPGALCWEALAPHMDGASDARSQERRVTTMAVPCERGPGYFVRERFTPGAGEGCGAA